ncbi:hypothetical protein [Roseibium aggregatum]|uniref:DUF4350 domain-containing protein n=1 Tax=Roseibium aggregatum TaxID=187304 RepID=A0A939EI44_9HYPH|nr:hypothetical protein [Roseibium aggregatum]MBN9673383.1 hypothetical protein [Roseibium aggregatum]
MSGSVSVGRPGAIRLETVAITVVCAIVLAAGWYILSQRQQSLRQSPGGLDGLQVWLASNGVSAQNFTGGWLMDQTSIGLLIQPVYDTVLDKGRDYPATKEELLLQQDEYDLTRTLLLRKARRVPSLVVLPKWRSGMRLTGMAHPVLLVERNRLNTLLADLTGDSRSKISYAETPFTDFRFESSEDKTLRAKVYAAQMFQSDACEPVLGNRDAMILADCALPKEEDAKKEDADEDSEDIDRVLILSDPDLLNNHGLRLGDNARIVLDLVRARAEESNVVIDYSRSVWLRDPITMPERERTWSDLLRFFEQPFLTLWIGAGLLLTLFLWRAALRYGPVRPETTGPGAGKMLAVQARARLMRLSGQDGALVGEYAVARVAAAATTLFGAANARHYSSGNAFLKYTERRHPAYANRLRAALESIDGLPAHLPASAAIHKIDELEQVLELITHDT